MNERLRVVIAGHGQMGHALESLLRGRADLRIWEVTPQDLRIPGEVADLARDAGLLFICVPTPVHAAVLTPLLALLPAATGVLSIAKGLDDAGRTAAGILHETLSPRPWGVLGGPMIAHEIQDGRAAFAEVGTADAVLFARCRALFEPGRLQLTHSLSPSAVSWCGVLKNIYAPLLGICDELHWGDNTRGHIVMGALAEMKSLLAVLAGSEREAYGDAGLADFIATVSSPSSHHYALGRQVARNERPLPECEGLHSLRILQQRGRVDVREHPLYGVAAGLIAAPADVPGALHGWLTRDL